MPLDKQLKSDMTGTPADASNTKKQNEKPVPEPAKKQEFPEVKPIITPAPAPEVKPKVEPAHPVVPPAPQPSASEQMKLLKTIESQLKGLNDNILSLEKAVADCKNPDFRAVFAKIDSARMSIEKMIPAPAPAPAPDPKPAEENEKSMSEVMALLQSVLEKQEKNDRQLSQSLRDNANFQIQVRQGMQRDIDKLKEQLNGEQFNPILKEIATVYVEYHSLLDDETISGRSRKNLKALFETLEDLMADYDAEVIRSKVGDERQTRVCKIIGKIPTGQQDKHNTIAASRQPGVVRDRSVLYPEFIDVYIYDPALAEAEASAAAEEEQPAAIETEAEEKTVTPETEAVEAVEAEKSEAEAENAEEPEAEAEPANAEEPEAEAAEPANAEEPEAEAAEPANAEEPEAEAEEPANAEEPEAEAAEPANAEEPEAEAEEPADAAEPEAEAEEPVKKKEHSEPVEQKQKKGFAFVLPFGRNKCEY